MAQIMINTDIKAPGCPCEIVLLGDNGEELSSLLVQSDWDYPGYANAFGWSVSDVPGRGKHKDCEHDGTDGTVKCPKCGVEAGAFIASAYEFLTDNDGLTAEDPGYFEGQE